MESYVKKAIKAGKSSAVILPRAWLDKEIRVELVRKTPERILFEVLEIVSKHIDLINVIGVYLTGSYARGEEDANSDIDILVVTEDIDKEVISEGVYHVLIVSSVLLKQRLKSDLLPVGQMIKEAEPLLNEVYLDSFDVKVTKKNVKWHLDTTTSKLKLINKILKQTKKKTVGDAVVYTLVLRMRTLYIIDNLLKSKDYSKKEFVKMIEKISKGAYERYLAVKNNLPDKKVISVEDAGKMRDYLENYLKDLKKRLG